VAAQDIEVVSLTRHPEPDTSRRRAKRVVLQALAQQPRTDPSGLPVVGGSAKHVVKSVDFGISPIQDHQQFLLVDHQGDLRYRGPRAQLLIVRSDLWVDIAVVGNAGKGLPVVLYRIDRRFDQPERIQLFPSGTLLDDGAAMATLSRRMRIGQALFENGQPIIDRVGGRILCAKRFEPWLDQSEHLFQMLNDMNESMNDLTLLAMDRRPPVVPIETWAPRVMVDCRLTKSPRSRLDLALAIHAF
jgi:hypothetical protein